MDIDCRNFQSELHPILRHISRSRFVSFDLELSGIPGKQINRPRVPGQGESGKQTLQQRYEETKRAAERYQVLQMGLTCVEEDLGRGLYTLRPYNFFLNPVPDKRLEVEREFTYQSGAVDFLLSHNFRMEAPFLLGVPYFSREEEAAARSIALARMNKSSVADIHLNPDDVESFKFLRRVRQEVFDWKFRSTPDPSFLNIAPVGHNSPGYNGRGLNGFQKRLVHQFIRAEHPDLVSIPRHDFIQIVPYDREREETQNRKKLLWFDRTLVSQIGLRWIVEAMCPDADTVLPLQHAPPNSSGDLVAIAPWAVSPVDTTESQAPGDRFTEFANQLKQRRTMLVGHNLFLDLIYFYSCFFGPLPERVEDFQSIMRRLFPLIFDTKYLADTINQNSPAYKSSLDEIDQELSKLPVPLIEVPPEHSRYVLNSPTHEAGFDSFLTAKVLIRLSARTEGTTQVDVVPSSEDEAYYTPSEDGGVALNQEISSVNRQEIVQTSILEGASSGDELLSDEIDSPAKYRKTKTEHSSNFSHENLFDLLADESPERGSQPSSLKERHTMMPSAESSFWKLYGNKLRVNGTIEEMCVIV